MAAMPTSSCNLTGQAQLAPDRLPCNAVPPAFLHGQVPERKFQTGCPLGRSKNDQEVMLYAAHATMKW